MPRRNRLPNLVREKTRHGKICWYYRKGTGKRVRLYSDYGTREFKAEYEAAAAGHPPSLYSGQLSGSLFWALSLYRQSPRWLALAKATRRQRDNIFVKKAGASRSTASIAS